MRTIKERAIVSISIPMSGQRFHPDNTIIIAKLDSFGSEIPVEVTDFDETASSSWLSWSQIYDLFRGRSDIYRVAAVQIYYNRLVAQVVKAGDSLDKSTGLTLVPNKSKDIQFFLARYEAQVFSCQSCLTAEWEAKHKNRLAAFRMVRCGDEKVQKIPEVSIPGNNVAEVAKFTAKSVSIIKSETLQKKPSMTKGSGKKSSKAISSNTSIASTVEFEYVATKLKEKGWIIDGEKPRGRTCRHLLDCARYVVAIQEVTGSRSVSGELIKYLSQEFNLPSLERIQNLLGSKRYEWNSNAREWLR